MITPRTARLVRERTDIVALISETVKLATAGLNLIGVCPFHKEKTPGFSVVPDQQFYCFGCGATGDAFDWLVKLEGLSYTEAIERLAERAGIELEETQSGSESP